MKISQKEGSLLLRFEKDKDSELPIGFDSEEVRVILKALFTGVWGQNLIGEWAQEGMGRVVLEKVSICNYFEEFSLKGNRKMEQRLGGDWDVVKENYCFVVFFYGGK